MQSSFSTTLQTFLFSSLEQNIDAPCGDSMPRIFLVYMLSLMYYPGAASSAIVIWCTSGKNVPLFKLSSLAGSLLAQK